MKENCCIRGNKGITNMTLIVIVLVIFILLLTGFSAYLIINPKTVYITQNTPKEQDNQTIGSIQTEQTVSNSSVIVTEKEDMGKYYDKIIKTKPGITGLWQTSGRNDITFKRRCIIEAYYSCIVSIRLDIKIFFKTFKVVLFGRGAK